MVLLTFATLYLIYMIYSMTGYGKSVLQLPTKKVTIELKSLNSKSIDLNVRMPSIYREKELDIRKQLAKDLERGKVDFSIYVETTADDTSTQINTPVVQKYMQQLNEVVPGDGIELLKMAMRLPDALNTVREEINEAEWQHIEAGIKETIDAITQYRLDEGKILEADFKARIETLSNLLEEVINFTAAEMVAKRI